MRGRLYGAPDGTVGAWLHQIKLFKCQASQCEIKSQRTGHIPDMPGFAGISGYFFFAFRVTQNKSIEGGMAL